jgi:hypothetical protein
MQSTVLTQVQKNRVENILNIITLQTERVEFSERNVLFENMMGYIFENPIFGNGIMFSNIIRGHNTIFGTWADAGIVCFLVFLYLLYLYIIKSIRSPDSFRFFSLSVATILIIFMLSLQTIINQGYLIVVLVLIGYVLDRQRDVFHLRHNGDNDPSIEKMH